MNKTVIIIATALLSFSICKAQIDEKGKFPAGIVYGPKGAYKIDAPGNWILDNKSGLSMGLLCVLYINGYNWGNSPVIMYAKIASTEYEKIDSFIEFTIKEFKKKDPSFFHKELKTGNIDSNKYVIMDYQGGPYDSYERVFYFQMEKAIGYVVFSARNENDFEKYSDAIFEIVQTYEYKPEYINYKE